MPGFDKRGPLGEGPKTGWGMGVCNNTSNNLNRRAGLGRGFGRGRGAGRGLGRGRGMGFGAVIKRTLLDNK